VFVITADFIVPRLGKGIMAAESPKIAIGNTLAAWPKNFEHSFQGPWDFEKKKPIVPLAKKGK